jgi:mono/diheme cytochrome c family protein
MSLGLRASVLLGIGWIATTGLLAAELSPRVLGWGHYAASREGPHAAAPQVATRIRRKEAPILDAVGARVRPGYLRALLSDPAQAKPGTTMPHVLGHLAPAERQEVVECLVHFLATTGSPTYALPMRLAVERGQRLYHEVGCVVCHGPRPSSAASTAPAGGTVAGNGTAPDVVAAGAPQASAAVLPLGVLSQKYTLPALTAFLQDPLAVRPSGRMPHLNLTAGEARDLASFLLDDLDIVSGLRYAYYEGDWEQLPDFSRLTPVAEGDASQFDLAPALARGRNDHFALRFEGTLQITAPGEYLFLIGSDDGSRLWIDGKRIVENDGVHPFQQRRKKLRLDPGLYSVVVEYFEQAGGQELQVDFEGPGMPQQPLASLLAAPVVKKGSHPSDEPPLTVDPDKASRGKTYFARYGCANCHTLRVDGAPIPPQLTAPPLHQLDPARGCLAPSPGRQVHYALDAAQRKALASALRSLAESPPALTPEETIRREMVRFHCDACHQRGDFGGVDPSLQAFFQTDMPEMGDEGRLPPSLTGVGAKLTDAWLQQIFERGASDRPYMRTRMPRFGLVNVGPLLPALLAADHDLVPPAPTLAIPPDDEKRIKAAGRRLVGSQGFSCIKCHTFAGYRSTGIQALSLTTMTRRLRRDWFFAYLQSPLAFRPGTRMPTPFPDGQTTLPGVLDGSVASQTEAIWRYLGDGDDAQLPLGLVTGKIELVAFDEPVIYRNFIEGAGPRAIGVGYPEKLNLAFDAQGLRLALLWHGGFIDAARHWTGRGAGFEKPLGDRVLALPDGPPLARLATPEAPWPKEVTSDVPRQFGGYRLDSARRPIFLYTWEGVRVEDELRPTGEPDLWVMQRTLRFTALRPVADLYLRLVVADRIEPRGMGRYQIEGRWQIAVRSGAAPVLRSGSKSELLVPIHFENSQAHVEVTYDW